MIFVKAYEISRLAMIFLDLRASYANNKKEKMIQPTNSHLPTENGMKKHPSWVWHLLKISLDHVLVVNIVVAEKISET